MTNGANSIGEIVQRKDEVDIAIDKKRAELHALNAEKQALLKALKKRIIEESAFDLLTVNYSKIRPHHRS